MLLPDIAWIAEQIHPTQKIKRLQIARQTLFTDDAANDQLEFKLKRGDVGFEEAIDALQRAVSIRGTPIEIVVEKGYGHTSTAEVRYDAGGDSAYAIDQRVDPAYIDRQLQAAIEDAKQNAEERLVSVGVLCLLFGFIVQLIGVM